MFEKSSRRIQVESGGFFMENYRGNMLDKMIEYFCDKKVKLFSFHDAKNKCRQGVTMKHYSWGVNDILTTNKDNYFVRYSTKSKYTCRIKDVEVHSVRWVEVEL